MPRKPFWKAVGSQPRKRWLLPAGIVLIMGAAWGVHWCLARPRIAQVTSPAVISKALLQVLGTPPEEPRSCVQCHANEVADWKESHHANANRLFDPATDLAAFRRSRYFNAKGLDTKLEYEPGTAAVSVTGTNGSRTVFHPEAVSGVTPLAQYLLPCPSEVTIHLRLSPWLQFRLNRSSCRSPVLRPGRRNTNLERNRRAISPLARPWNLRARGAQSSCGARRVS